MNINRQIRQWAKLVNESVEENHKDPENADINAIYQAYDAEKELKNSGFKDFGDFFNYLADEIHEVRGRRYYRDLFPDDASYEYLGDDFDVYHFVDIMDTYSKNIPEDKMKTMKITLKDLASNDDVMKILGNYIDFEREKHWEEYDDDGNLIPPDHDDNDPRI